MNEMAAEIAKMEKGKKQVNIAQIKEVLRKLAILVANDSGARKAVIDYANRFKRGK